VAVVGARHLLAAQTPHLGAGLRPRGEDPAVRVLGMELFQIGALGVLREAPARPAGGAHQACAAVGVEAQQRDMVGAGEMLQIAVQAGAEALRAEVGNQSFDACPWSAPAMCRSGHLSAAGPGVNSG
jgi:hypothetical protein